MAAGRVLIIEDDPTMRRALKDNFEYEGYAVAVAGDGEQGLEAGLRDEADLVILDIMMPKVNGYEVCRQLRAAGVEAGIIMLTAKGEEPDVLLGLEVGADDYVTKPFSIRELLARARGLLRRRSAATSRAREYEDRLRDFAHQSRTQELSLQRAREFQESLMGGPAVRRGVRVAAAHRFCEMLGGDFYDVLDAGDDALGLLLADVSGHGVDAALVTGMLKVQVASCEQADDPAAFLHRLNAALFPLLSEKGLYLTMAYAVVDGPAGAARYANAGHNPIAVCRSAGGLDEFASTAPPVGMLPDLPVDAGEFSVAPGDSIWLYTDGLFEPAGLGRDDSGRRWLLDVIDGARSGDLQARVEAVLAASQRAAEGSPIDDDMALLAAARTAS